MLAIDTSSLIAYFHDDGGPDVDAVAMAFEDNCAVFCPVVLTEMLSDHTLTEPVAELLKLVPRLEIKPGYWARSGQLRSSILKRGFKARLADTLIAQSCIDWGVPLITRDQDFKHFAKYGKLLLWGK